MRLSKSASGPVWKMISRRQFVYFFALLLFWSPLASPSSSALANEPARDNHSPATVDILREAYWAELSAQQHYDAYAQQALVDKFLEPVAKGLIYCE